MLVLQALLFAGSKLCQKLCRHMGLNMCLESQPVFANDGSRAYTDFASGTWLEPVQVPLRIA